MFKLKKKREEDTVEIVQLDGPSVILEKTKNNTTTDKKKQKVTKSEKNVGPGENSKTGKSHNFKTAKNTCTTVKSGLKKVNEADSNSKNDISLSKQHQERLTNSLFRKLRSRCQPRQIETKRPLFLVGTCNCLMVMNFIRPQLAKHHGGCF